MSNPIPGDDAGLTVPLSAIREICMSQWINRTMGDLSAAQLAHNAAISRCLGMLKARAAAPVTADVAADSIDTPEFRKFMWDHWNGYGWNSGKQKCVEFIDGHFRAAGAPDETAKAEQGFEAWWTGRSLPDNLKAAFFMVWQAASEDGESGGAPQIDATTAPVGEIVMFGSECKEVSWTKGKMPPVGTKLYPAPATAPDVAKDAARLDKMLDWYLNEGKRSSIDPYGHISPTTKGHIIHWLDGGSNVDPEVRAAMGALPPTGSEKA